MLIFFFLITFLLFVCCVSRTFILNHVINYMFLYYPPNVHADYHLSTTNYPSLILLPSSGFECYCLCRQMQLLQGERTRMDTGAVAKAFPGNIFIAAYKKLNCCCNYKTRKRELAIGGLRDAWVVLDRML